MSQSSLVSKTILTTHFGYPTGKAGRGSYKIDKIFVHHMAGNLTIEQCGNVFKTREASAHYGIGKDGRIGQYVKEENVAWHCASKEYNSRSIGIELANDGGASTNWHVNDKTIEKCIDLIVDICKRNGITKINYTGDLKGNLCMHSWIVATACPGGYLKTKFKYIAEQVNKKLTPVEKVSEKRYVKVTSYRNCYDTVKKNKFIVKVPEGSILYVTKRNGKWLYVPALKGWICETDTKIGMCVKTYTMKTFKANTTRDCPARSIPVNGSKVNEQLKKGKQVTGRDLVNGYRFAVKLGWVTDKWLKKA